MIFNHKLKNKNIVLLIYICILALLSGCTAITPKVIELTSCSNISQSGKALENKNIFSTNDSTIYISAKTSDIIENTMVSVIWYYSSDKINKEKIYTSNTIINESKYLKSHLTIPNGLPKGYYYAEFYINNRSFPDKTAAITVQSSD